ncbi:MAG: hypothetical protein PHY26_00955 [Bacilli bacterium]|jgi:RNase H-fold protein (predicted Holliday junction resolvase)|nr:hypothetical protein [Bacilli bacterium]
MNLKKIKHDPRLVELINKTNQKVLARWAIDCVERFMPLFEKKYPNEKRPRDAINMLKKWITVEVKMWDARKYTYPVLVAARELEKTDKASSQIARACSHTLATCHVPIHAEGAAMYTVSALYYLNQNKDNVNQLLEDERNWQIDHLIELRNKKFNQH